MNTQKIYFFSNLRFLRERRKLTQEQVSDAIGVHRIKYTNLENGKTKSPSMDEYLQLSRFHRLSIDTLLKVDLKKIGELKLRELENGDDVYIKGGNIRVLAITVDPDNNENVEYVPVKVKMGYSSGGFSDPDFLGELPKFSLPNLPKGTFRGFPAQGESMLPIPDGCDIIGKFVQDWSLLSPRTPAVVVLNSEQDFVFKLVTIQNDGMALLESLNPLFEPYKVNVDQIAEIWQFYSYMSREIPEPQTDLNIVLRELRDIKEVVTGK
jgi:transcriptional regulator with XRE-family HTH domain